MDDDVDPRVAVMRDFAKKHGITISVRIHDEETESSGLLTYETRINVVKKTSSGTEYAVTSFVPNLHRYTDDSLPPPTVEDVIGTVGMLIRAAITGIVKPGDEQYDKAMAMLNGVIATMGQAMAVEYLALFGITPQGAQS